MIEVSIVILGGYSRKFSRRQYKIKLCRDKLGEQIASGKHTFRRAQNLKNWQTWYYLRDISGLLKTVLNYSEVGTYEDPIPVDQYQNFFRYISGRDLSKNFDAR